MGARVACLNRDGLRYGSSQVRGDMSGRGKRTIGMSFRAIGAVACEGGGLEELLPLYRECPVKGSTYEEDGPAGAEEGPPLYLEAPVEENKQAVTRLLTDTIRLTSVRVNVFFAA